VVAFGIVLRLIRYLSDRSLRVDEAYLAINLMTRSYRDLLETLDFNQGAPIGFLWAERLMLELFGDGELSLRFVPLLVGLVSLGLFFLVAREVLQQAALLIALVLVATMEPFVRYSAEMKQYGSDVAVTLALLYLYVRVFKSRRSGVRLTIVLALAGPLAVWLSHPAIFVLTGVATAGLYVAVRGRDRGALAHQAVAYGVWLLSFLVVYLVAVRDLDDLRQTVQSVGSTWSERIKNLYAIFNEPGEFVRTSTGLAAAVALIGLICLWRRRSDIIVLFAATIFSLLIAGYLGMYPIGGRFLLFLLPIAVLCIAEGITGIARITPRSLACGLLFAVAALILLPVVGSAARQLVVPPKNEEIEPLLEQLASEWRAGDLLYLDPASQYAFRYYVECDDCSPVTSTARRLWPSHPTQGGQPQSTPAIVSESSSLIVGVTQTFGRARLGGKSRVWLLFTHFVSGTEEELLEKADLNGTRIRCTHGGASLLCLYDFRRRPVP